ncbi:MAG: Ig-like domain-containing protein, partial [Candidatus Brocadiia bacterium]
SLACGGGSGTSTTVTPTPTGTITPTTAPPSGPAFAITEPLGPSYLPTGDQMKVRWSATGYASNLVVRVSLDDDTDPGSVLETFPVTYGNGANYLDWNTVGKNVGKYYFLFTLQVGENIERHYAPAINLVDQNPTLVPPTLQLITPLSAKTVYPSTKIAIRFRVANCDATCATTVGIDDDQVYGNGVTQWFANTWNGPGTFDYEWDTVGLPNGKFYIAVRATANSLSTYVYSRPVTIADFINLGAPPVVEFLIPTDAILVTAGSTVNVRFSMTDVDSPCTGRLILDNDTDSTNGWVKIVYDNLEPGIHTYDWNTLGISPGVFFFLVVASDGLNETEVYTKPIIVNPVGGLTQPPSVTITKPSHEMAVAAGTPIAISGSVTDPDSEAIVQIGIDNDDIYSNGVIGIISSTFTGAYSANWITAYSPPGFYRVFVSANDGLNTVTKYSDPIELRYLMPSGFTTNKLAGVNNFSIFDGVDSVGAYHALHAAASSSSGIYHTTNVSGLWNTSSVTASGFSSSLFGIFDDSDDVHYMYASGYGNLSLMLNRLSVSSAVVVSPSAPKCTALALIPFNDGNDFALVATASGTTARFYVSIKSGTLVNRTTIATIADNANGYSNFWGWMANDSFGRTHVVYRACSQPDELLPATYPVYYANGKDGNWITPMLLTTQEADTFGINAYMENDTVHVFAQLQTNMHYDRIGGTHVSEFVLPVPVVGTNPDVTWGMMKMVQGTPNVVWRTGNEMRYSTRTGTDTWTNALIGGVLTTSEVEWLVTPSDDLFVFANDSTGLVSYKWTALGWARDVVVAEQGTKPSAAYVPNGDIVVAFRTAGVGEKRLNFARRTAGGSTWVNNKLANDVADSSSIRIFANQASNIYMRYFTVDNFVGMVTYR